MKRKPTRRRLPALRVGKDFLLTPPCGVGNITAVSNGTGANLFELRVGDEGGFAAPGGNKNKSSWEAKNLNRGRLPGI